MSSRDNSLSSRLWHALFNLVACGLLLTALTVSVGRALLPLAAEYRSELERELAIRLGQPVLIGRLGGRWQGLAPELWVEDVQIGGEQGALHLDHLRLVPDLPASLLARQLRVALIEASGLQLALQEQADGRWLPRGLALPVSDAGTAPELTPEALSGWLQRLVVLDSRLTLEDSHGEVHSLNYLGLTLSGSGRTRRLDARVLLPDGEPVMAHASLQLGADWAATRVSAYLALPQSQWHDWLAGRLPAGWQLPQLQGGGELWLEWADTALQRAALRLHLPQLALDTPWLPQRLQLSEIDLSAWLQRSGEGWQLRISDLGLLGGEARIAPGQLQLHYSPAGVQGRAQPRVELQAEHLELAPVSALLTRLAALPPVAQEVIDTLALHGRLEDVQASFSPQPGGLPQLDYRMRVERLGFAAWHGVPAAANISGSLSGSLQGGELRLDSRDFMLHLAQLFPEPWHYREAHASLQWRLDQESFRLYSPLMQVSGDEGELAGNMLLQIFLDHRKPDQLQLQVGLRNGPAELAGRYFPSRAPGFDPALDAWLRAAIGSGQVDRGLFLWNGSLHRDARATDHELALYFGVRDVELAYQAGWPALQHLEGEVRVDGRGVRIQAPTARLQDAQLSNLQAEVALGSGKPPRLQVQGDIAADLATTLQVLQDSPLAAQLPFAGWQGQGALQGRLRLGIPLAAGAPALRVETDFSSTDAVLTIPEPALEIRELAGRFRFDTASGFSAREMRARVLGERVRGSATATGRPGAPATRLDLQGSVAVERLVRWLDADPRQIPVSGRLPYRLQLQLGAGRNRLQLQSDLQGVNIDLPPPFGKPAAEARAASWRMGLGTGEQRYSLRYGELGRLFLAAQPGQLLAGRGELWLGEGSPRLPRQAGLRVRGRLAHFDWAIWQDWWRTRPAAADAAGLGVLLRELQVQIQQLQLGSLQLQDTAVGLRPQQDGWLLSLDNRLLAGSIGLPASGALQVKLERVHLPGSAGSAAAGSDPLSAIDPSSLPAMDVQVADVQYDSRQLGRWSFRARPHEGGMRFDQLALELAGMRASGVLDWHSGSTHFDGRIEGERLEEVLQNWGGAPGITSRSFLLGARGRWPGSPAQAGLQHFTGSLLLRADDGQIVEGAAGTRALRLFGILNLDAIRRRLRLDFSDLFGKGLAYDSIHGRLDGIDGIFLTGEPLVLDGPSTRLELDGQLDMASDRVAARLAVTLPISNNLPLAALLAGAAPVAGALLIVDRLVGERLSKVASVTYQVDGPWQDPQISLWGDTEQESP